MKSIAIAGLLFSLLFAVCPCAIVCAKVKPDKDAQFITTFHFKELTGGLIIIHAQINDFQDTLNFIFDTGCSSLALDSETCERYKLKTFKSDKYILGIGSKQRAVFTEQSVFRLPGLTIDSAQFHVSDYQLLSETYGLHIDGIIGFSIIKNYIIQVNFDSLTLSFYKPGAFKYGAGGTTIFTPLDLKIPLLNATLKNGKKINNDFYFDMGAGLNMIFTKRFIDDNSLLTHKYKKRKYVTTELQGNEDRIRMTLTTYPKIKIAGYTFRKVPMYEFEDFTDVMKYPRTGGVMGNDLFRRFNITLNYPRQEIFLQPNSHFHESFDYSYTGLCFYFINGKVEITGVIPASPADKAGFKEGDIIMAVDKNFSNDIQAYQKILKRTKNDIPIIISRNGELINKKILVGSIL